MGNLPGLAEEPTLAPPQGRVTGALGLPVPEQRPGDCFVWGSCDAAASTRPGAAALLGAPAAGGCAWQHSDVPVLASDTHHLDVAEVGLS